MKRSPRPRQWCARGLWLAAATVVAAGIALPWGFSWPLRVNFTGSLPRGLYRTRKGPPSRGAMVIACLPADIGRLARERGYLWQGDCPGGAAPVGKIVSATGGDTIVLSAAGLVVNGRPIVNTRPLARDNKGRPLTHAPYGVYKVAQGQLWLTSSFSPLSFDSRYFGPVPTTAVISPIEPIVTFGKLSSSSRSAGKR